MPHSTAYTRYRAEADFAFSRLKVSREAGDAARAEHWHQAWSHAEVAAEAEAREKGGGARVARLKTPVPLRPLPDDVPPLPKAPELPLGEISPPMGTSNPGAEALAPPVHDRAPSAESAARPSLEEEVVPPPPDEALQRAMQRHASIDAALRAGGPNPFPEEMNEGQWQYHLTAFRVGGPYDCELLQAAEEGVEAIVEFLPEPWEPDEDPESAVGPLESPVLLECLDIYVESLPDLTEEELRADLISNLEAAGANDLTRLIEAELRKREGQTASEPPTVAGGGMRAGESPSTVCREIQPARAEAEPTVATRSSRPRDRKTTYGANARRSVGRNPLPQPPKAVVNASAPPTNGEHTTAPAWIDAAGRTRTWSLLDPSGEKLAEIATKRDAEKMAARLNSLVACADTPSTERFPAVPLRHIPPH